MAKIFDPRIGKSIETDNPALILLQLLQNKFRADELVNEIIPRIMEMADDYDEVTHLRRQFTHCGI